MMKFIHVETFLICVRQAVRISAVPYRTLGCICQIIYVSDKIVREKNDRWNLCHPPNNEHER